MPFNSETGKLAGQKSVRGKDKVGSELRNKLKDLAWKRLYCEISGVKEPFMYVKFVLMKIEIKLLFVLLRI